MNGKNTLVDTIPVFSVEARYKIMLPEIIQSYKNELISSDEIEKFMLKELNVIGDSKRLTGGRVSSVYKINQGGQENVVKFSTGLYRMIELKREAQVLRYLVNKGFGHIVPYISSFKMLDNFAYIVEDYIEGISAREKLSATNSTKERIKIWESIGQVISEIHRLYQDEDIYDEWIKGQLEIARLNMENDLLDSEEFQEETPERMLLWLMSNKPRRKRVSILHGDFRTKNIIINNEENYKIIDWGFVDIGDPYYDLAIIDYYFKDSLARESFYRGYNENKYDKDLIEYFDKLSKFINV